MSQLVCQSLPEKPGKAGSGGGGSDSMSASGKREASESFFVQVEGTGPCLFEECLRRTILVEALFW